MSRQLVYLAAALVATACAPDATAPAPAREPAPSALLVSSVYGYQATVLPLSQGKAINSSGAVVGLLPGGTGVYYANGAVTPLALISPLYSVSPQDLTDDGRIVAVGYGDYGAPAPTAMYYSSPTASPRDIAPGHFAEASAINSQGVVVGRYGIAAGALRKAFRWTLPGGLVDITLPGCDQSSMSDISETGYAVGSVRCGNTPRRFRWDPISSAGMPLPDAVHAMYQVLNDGRVLVRYQTSTSLAPGIWSPPSTLAEVGPNPSSFQVLRISPNGRYVGHYKDPLTGQDRAWTSIGTGAVITLPLPAGFVSAAATHVNACGTILGYGWQASSNIQSAIVWSRSLTCDLPPGTASTF